MSNQRDPRLTYAEAGVDTVFIWPLADGTEQLERFMTKVAPLV